MRKEAIISIVLIIIIIIGNIITQRYAEKTINTLTSKLEELKIEILEDKKEKSTDKNMDEIIEKWDIKHVKLAYFIEHNELERIEINLIGMKSYIRDMEKTEAVSKIEETKFLLENLEKKYKIHLENIF